MATTTQVQQAVCGPTRASLLTGRRPDTLRTVTHTSPTYWRERAGDFATIPQMFKERGYTTLSYGKVFDLRTSSHNQSTEWICDGPYSWTEPPQLCGTTTWTEDSKLSRGLSHRLLDPEEEPLVSDVVITTAAIKRLQDGSLRAPWFVAVGVHRPHLPFIVPQRHLDLYPLSAVPLPEAADRDAPVGMPSVASECAGTYQNDPSGGCLADHGSFEMWQQYLGGFNASSSHNQEVFAQKLVGAAPPRAGWGGWNGAVNTSLPDSQIRELRQYYFAAVSHTDEMLGRVIDAAVGPGPNDTIVVLVGDHGWHLSENAMWAKCTLFESATRAPVIVRVPGVTDRGLVSHQLTEHVDVMATLAAAAGFPAPPLCAADSRRTHLCTEGINVLPLMTSPTAALRKAAYSQWPHPFSQQPNIMGFSVRTVDARYTEWVAMNYPDGAHVANWSSVCGRELYDYSVATTGVGERRNVVSDASMAHKVATMRQYLHAGWRPAVAPGPWPPQLPDVPQTQLLNCGPAGMPPAPPPALCSGTVEQCIVVHGDVNFNEAPELPGYPRVLPTAMACEEACMAAEDCASGLWLSGSVRHGDCYLTARAGPARHDFCGAHPGQQCVGFVRRPK